MNILMVADVSIAKVIGGAERVLFEQATRLANRGHKVHVLTRKEQEHLGERQKIGPVTEWRYDVDQTSGLSYLKSTITNGGQLFASLQEEHGFDCIIFHQPFSAYAVIKQPLSRGIRKIYICHSLAHEEFVTRNVKPGGILGKTMYFLNTKARKWIEHKSMQQSDKIVVLSDYTRRKLHISHAIKDKKICLIPGGVDLKRFTPTADKPGIRRRLGISEDKTILFTVRNLVPRMGLGDLIRAMHLVNRETADIFLVIGGSGPLREELGDLIRKMGLEDSVSLVGFIPEEKLSDYYAMADLFVLATKDLEGFGLITLEAMASGVPVLGTPVGGTREILAAFNSDFLFADTTPEAVASLILKTFKTMTDDPQTWQTMPSKVRSFVEDNYSWERNVDFLEKLFPTSS